MRTYTPEVYEYMKKYRELNREKLREYNRIYNKNWRKKYGYHNEEKSAIKFADKEKARGILQQAVFHGKVIRGACCVCGKVNAQGHHEDYSKPLDVIWLCALHHKHRHNGVVDKSEVSK